MFAWVLFLVFVGSCGFAWAMYWGSRPGVFSPYRFPDEEERVIEPNTAYPKDDPRNEPPPDWRTWEPARKVDVD